MILLALPLGTALLVGISFGIKAISLNRVQHAANEAALTYARHCIKLRDNRLSKVNKGSLGAMGIKGGDNANLASDLAQIDFSYAGLESLYNAGSATIPIGEKAALPGAMTLEYTEASQVLLYNLWKKKIPDASWVHDIRQNQCYISHDKSSFSLNKKAKPNICAVNEYISSPFMSLKWLFMASKYGEGVCCTKNTKACTKGGEYDFCVVVKITGRLDPVLEGGIPFLQNLGIIKDGNFTVQARADVKNMANRFSNRVIGDTITLSKAYPQNCEFSCNHPPILSPISDKPIEALINVGQITPESLSKCTLSPEECIRIEPNGCEWESAAFPEQAYLRWNPDLVKIEKPDGSHLIKDLSDNAIFLSAKNHYKKRGKKQGRIVISSIDNECTQNQRKCGSNCLLDIHCAGASDGCTVCKNKICTSSNDKCGRFCVNDADCKNSLTCPNCLKNICTSDFCNQPCVFNNECAPSDKIGCNECSNGRCAKTNCQWDVNNLVPVELEAKSGLKECDLKNLYNNHLDGAACSKDGDLCSAPWVEPPPAELFENLTQNDLNDEAVKVFRCACNNPKNAENDEDFTWDFQRYAFLNEQIPFCPPVNNLPQKKVDNSACQMEGSLCQTVEAHIFGKKVFKCEQTNNTTRSTECRWDLNTFTTMKLKGNIPACVADMNNSEKYNNVACLVSEEGNLCYKPKTEPFTLDQMKNGWRKRFQCDCAPKPPAQSCSWDVNGFVKASIQPTANLPECSFSEEQKYIDGSNCQNIGEGCLTPWIETPNINGNCINGSCDNFVNKTCSLNSDCPATFPYFEGGENDQNIKMVKLFRCSCGDDKQSSWDFQRFLDTTSLSDMALPLCPDASKLPNQKLDNYACDLSREDKCRTLDRIFRCESPNSGCRLDLNNFTPSNAPLPECPENAGTVNNVDCSAYGEGWRCKKTGASEDQLSLDEFRQGWKKVFRCDCHETLNCTNYCN